MAAASAFVTTYLTAPYVLPAGSRQQLAGLVYAMQDFYARGGTGTPPVTKRNMRIVYAAERDSSPNQANLSADFFAINGA